MDKINNLEYRGFHAKFNHDLKIGCIVDIEDLVTFEAEHSSDIEFEFHKAVDNYMSFCKDVGNYKCKKSIAITHCNEFRMDEYKFEKLFLGWNIYKSDGETHNSIKETK